MSIVKVRETTSISLSQRDSEATLAFIKQIRYVYLIALLGGGD